MINFTTIFLFFYFFYIRNVEESKLFLYNFHTFKNFNTYGLVYILMLI